MTALIMANITGCIALALWTSSVQINKKNIIMKMQLVANVCYAIQYFLIGAYTAACMNLISTIRYYIYTKNEESKKENNLFLLLIFLGSIIVVGCITYTNWMSLIPITITGLYTYGTWQKNTKILRLIFLLAAVVWIYYNAKVGAYISIIGNIIELLSGFIAILRFDTVNKTNSKKIDKKT